MNFYNRIKEEFTNDKNNRGYGCRVAVDRMALKLLIDDYERLNEKMRSELCAVGSFDHFESVVKWEYIENGRKSGGVFMKIASILDPIIKEDKKREEITEVYR